MINKKNDIIKDVFNKDKIEKQFYKKDNKLKTFGNTITITKYIIFFLILIIKFFLDFSISNIFLNHQKGLFLWIGVIIIVMIKNIYIILLSSDFIRNSYTVSIIFYLYMFIGIIVLSNILILFFMLSVNTNFIIYLLIIDILFILILLLFVYFIDKFK